MSGIDVAQLVSIYRKRGTLSRNTTIQDFGGASCFTFELKRKFLFRSILQYHQDSVEVLVTVRPTSLHFIKVLCKTESDAVDLMESLAQMLPIMFKTGNYGNMSNMGTEKELTLLTAAYYLMPNTLLDVNVYSRNGEVAL